MKPTVRYSAALGVKVGSSALIQPIDHPSGLVSNECWAWTTKVIAYDESTGNFETKNTLYVYDPLGDVETANRYEVKEL